MTPHGFHLLHCFLGAANGAASIVVALAQKVTVLDHECLEVGPQGLSVQSHVDVVKCGADGLTPLDETE